MRVCASLRDPIPERSFRRKLLCQVGRENGKAGIDGMAADDGHNALVSTFYCPSNSFFEQDPPQDLVWLFPPDDLTGLLLDFLEDTRKQGISYKALILVPEQVRAPWFRFCSTYKRVARFRKGSDLFRMYEDERWVKAPAARVPYMVLSLL